MAFNNLAVGNKVYNGGSNSANRGMTLDPSGYMERSRNQAAAKKRLVSSLAPRPGISPGQAAPPGAVPGQAASGSGGSSTAAVKAGTGTAAEGGAALSPNPNVGGLANMNLASTSGGGGAFVNQIRSFDTSLPDLPTSAPDIRLPGVPTNPAGQLKSKLDADFRMKQEQGYDSLSSTIAKLQNALAKMGQEYNVELREGKSEAQKGAAALAAQYAAMGGGPGSAYGQDYQEMTTDYGNFLNDLKTAFSQGRQDILSDRTSAQTQFQTLIRGLLGLQGQRDAKEKAEAALRAKTAAAAKAAAAKRAAALRAASSRSSSSYSSGGSRYSSGSSRYSSGGSSRSSSSSRTSTRAPIRRGSTTGTEAYYRAQARPVVRKKSTARVASGSYGGGGITR